MISSPVTMYSPHTPRTPKKATPGDNLDEIIQNPLLLDTVRKHQQELTESSNKESSSSSGSVQRDRRTSSSLWSPSQGSLFSTPPPMRAGTGIGSAGARRSMTLKESEDHHDKLSKENFGLKIKVTKLDEMAAKYAHGVEVCQGHIRKLTDEVERLTEENEKLQKKVKNQEGALADAASVITSLREKNVQLSENLDQATDRLTKLTTEKEELLSKLPPLATDEEGSSPVSELLHPRTPPRLVPGILCGAKDENVEVGRGGEDEDEEAPEDFLDSPRLSVLSERSFASIYGKRPLEHAEGEPLEELPESFVLESRLEDDESEPRLLNDSLAALHIIASEEQSISEPNATSGHPSLWESPMPRPPSVDYCRFEGDARQESNTDKEQVRKETSSSLSRDDGLMKFISDSSRKNQDGTVARSAKSRHRRKRSNTLAEKNIAPMQRSTPETELPDAPASSSFAKQRRPSFIVSQNLQIGAQSRPRTSSHPQLPQQLDSSFSGLFSSIHNPQGTAPSHTAAATTHANPSNPIHHWPKARKQAQKTNSKHQGGSASSSPVSIVTPLANRVPFNWPHSPNSQDLSPSTPTPACRSNHNLDVRGEKKKYKPPNCSSKSRRPEKYDAEETLIIDRVDRSRNRSFSESTSSSHVSRSRGRDGGKVRKIVRSKSRNNERSSKVIKVKEVIVLGEEDERIGVEEAEGELDGTSETFVKV